MRFRLATGRTHYDPLGSDHLSRARDSFRVFALASQDWHREIAGGFYAARIWAGVFVSLYVYCGFVGFAFFDCSGFLGFEFLFLFRLVLVVMFYSVAASPAGGSLSLLLQRK
jgi:hypothetical protein